MSEILIRGLPGLSQEELESLAQHFHHFAGKQRAAGHRYESLEALLKEYFARSRYATAACVLTGRIPEATDLVYQTLKGTFDRPAQFRAKEPAPESKVDALKQEAMLTIQSPLRPGLGRGR